MERIKPALGELGPTSYSKGPTSYSKGPTSDNITVCFLDYIDDNKMEKEIKYIVTADDLIGDIKGYPIEVAQKMVDYQVKQGNAPDVVTFQSNCLTSKFYGGFDWDETDEGIAFWKSVIFDKNFDLFFQKYPKNCTTDDPGSKGKEGVDGSDEVKDNRDGLTGPVGPNDYGCAGVFLPKQGEYVLVSQDNKIWYERIFLFVHNNIYYCLDEEDEYKYFNTVSADAKLNLIPWKFCNPIEIKLSINKSNSKLETYYINKQQLKMIEKIINNKD